MHMIIYSLFWDESCVYFPNDSTCFTQPVAGPCLSTGLLYIPLEP